MAANMGGVEMPMLQQHMSGAAVAQHHPFRLMIAEADTWQLCIIDINVPLKRLT